MPEDVENSQEVEETSPDVDELEALRNENEELIDTLQRLHAVIKN